MKTKIFLLVLLFINVIQYGNAQVVTTLAGGSGLGYADGTGSAAKFKTPLGIVANLDGNIYVADVENNRIRRITPTGVVTTFAGGGTSCTTCPSDGFGVNAIFYRLNAMCKDAIGNIYVGDNNANIRKVTPAQVVTTIANGIYPFEILGISLNSGNFSTLQNNQVEIVSIDGSGYILAGGGGSSVYVDGTGTAASFMTLRGICQDASGNNYVVDNNTIRKVTPSGVVTTIAGSTLGYVDAIGTSAKFNQPQGICIDPSGNLYVADEINQKIRKIAPNGLVTTIAAVTGYGAKGICIDTAGNLYVTCHNNIDNKIIKITLNLSIKDNISFMNDLKVYPNPTKNLLHIDLENALSGKITDLMGKTLMTINTKDIDVSSLSAGIYLLDIVSDGKRYNKKIIKE